MFTTRTWKGRAAAEEANDATINDQGPLNFENSGYAGGDPYNTTGRLTRTAYVRKYPDRPQPPSKPEDQ